MQVSSAASPMDSTAVPTTTSPAGSPAASTVASPRAFSPAASPAVQPVRLPAPASGLHATALATSNLLHLLQCQVYRNQLNSQLCAGVRSIKRDALDLAGKLPLAVKALAMGIAPHELIIDPAQAGGLLGKFDAAVCGASGAAKEGVEIKGAGSTSGPRTFKISRLRPGTPFEHLILVLRRADPTDRRAPARQPLLAGVYAALGL